MVIDGPANHEGEVPIESPAPSEQNTPGEKRMDQDKHAGGSDCEEHPDVYQATSWRSKDRGCL